MTKIVVYLFFFGLYAIQTVGQMNSDPAPGRSPGPPSESAEDINPLNSNISLRVENQIYAINNTNNNNQNENKTRNNVNGNNDQIINKSNRNISNLVNTTNVIDLKDTFLNDAKRFIERSTIQTDSLKMKSSYVESTEAASRPQNTANRKSLPCYGGFYDFPDNILDLDELERIKTESNSETHNSNEQLLVINLQLEHDIFDTVTTGITCGLMYRVRLITSTTTPAVNIPYESSKNITNYSGEFLVESVSTLGKRERGRFIEPPSVSNMPISWFSTLQRNFQDNSNMKKSDLESSASSDEENLTVINDHLNATADFEPQLYSNERPYRSQRNGKRCPDNKWANRVTSKHKNPDIVTEGDKTVEDETKNRYSAFTESLSLWILNELCEQEDVVEFRVFFRVTFPNANQGYIENTSNIKNQQIVYKKSFKFHIRKDCQLLIRENTSGVLDYTVLPLYNIDCTVRFPSYLQPYNEHNEDAPMPHTSPTAILVELERLNVPCSSSSYVRFNNRSKLCGKLEELDAADRSYHFDSHNDNFINLHESPMFSLSFKLIDSCYNVTTSNQTGEYYVRSKKEDVLECYFHIHLPYGNRIFLTLVTNNDSDVLNLNQASHLNSDELKSYSLFTSAGKVIETELINLTHIRSNFELSEWHTRAKRSANVKEDFYIFKQNFANRIYGNANLPNAATCFGIFITVFESDFSTWSFCLNNSHEMHGFFLKSASNILYIHLFKSSHKNTPQTDLNNSDTPTVFLKYFAQSVIEITSNCAFGWIAMQQFCVSPIEKVVTWVDAEQDCVSLGGHLVSIRNELQQEVVNELLLHSPGYNDQNAYWVGGSDHSYEGDFRWSDGLLFQYTNWFPGWTEHAHYNKQPNDDGLSNQDCIELRRFYRTPPGIQTSQNPLTNSFMWNDRDCGASNFYICERAMSDDSLQRSWINDCNVTLSLSKEHPRVSIWSPSFPQQYPDNANCFTTISAPEGYRLVIEFEELVIENEPGCTYDYLEIFEPSHDYNTQTKKSSSVRDKNNKKKNNNIENAKMNNKNNYNNDNSNVNKIFQKQSSYDNTGLSSYTTSTFTSNSNVNSNDNSISYNNYDRNNISSIVVNTNTNLYSNNYNLNLAQINYQTLLQIFSNLYRPHTSYLIQTPDYPKGIPHYSVSHQKHIRSDNSDDPSKLPKRLCGDWSSKLKLLRHVTSNSYLGLHFVSDYSHHFGGYKAKAYMENTGSECANERLKFYNGFCYLFISYPEVDWWTAQQICHGMGAKLSSVLSTDEHRFITSNIRNQIDYSPQLIYWLGAELKKSGEFEWKDDTEMSFQGWLPGQGQFDELPVDATCLGLQWKMSPTPMLPSGLYWQSHKCSKIGGYVCKMPKESYDKFSSNNLTVTGKEGRLVSPAYPNAYPLNMDYWIHIKTPERTRIIVQFQKIDLEPQDECLYDFISIQDFELSSHITLEPGSNSLPMAMFTSEERLLYSKSDYRIRRNVNNAQKRHNFHGDTPKNWKRKLKMGFKSKSTKTNRSYIEKSGKRSSINMKVIRKYNKLGKEPVNDRAIEHQFEQFGKTKNVHRRKRSTVLSDGEWLTMLPPNGNAQSFLPYVRWCGAHNSNMSKFDFVSASNQVMMNFHSDYSITGLGFAATWKAIDVSGCPLQTLTSREGTIASPNHPHFLINNLNCAYVLQAPAGRRVWLEFMEFNLISDVNLEIDVGNGFFYPFHKKDHLNEGIFVSLREQMRVQFHTGRHPRGKGFKAVYHTVAPLDWRERIIQFNSTTTGYLYQLNYPNPIPEHTDFTEYLIAPFGYNILLELHGVEFGENGCSDNSTLEVWDNYADNNGTKWQLCKVPDSAELNTARILNNTEEKSSNVHHHLSNSKILQNNPAASTPPVYITSYLNTLHIRQRITLRSNANLYAIVRIQWDNNCKLKLASGDKTVESCQPNPCLFSGKCVSKNGSSYCQCQGHYTGRFCGLNVCELEPCVFGRCELTVNSFKCQCQPGYMGLTCEQKQRPCADNPCEGRGICFEKNGGFYCRCHAWWEGIKCERRMLHIPYKPLSERMLQEPFWLGLITVFVVLAVIGLVWCAKRHFPEKIEKLLAEEADRNRPPGSIHGHHHHTSLREQLQFTTAIPQTTGNFAPGAQRSIFNRLGIRKPSLLSLSSPNPVPGGGGATARTFSLDDLLRPTPRRSPSPRKKRNNSTPVKKNAVEKKQILQQLVSPAANATKPKVSLSELITMTDNRLLAGAADPDNEVKETTFSENAEPSTSNAVNIGSRVIDTKLEKKVTFARLLNKVSAEMSSSSDVDIRKMTCTRNASALSLTTDMQFCISSMPPSPCTNDIRSPHSTSSNQGSDSLSSSDLALTEFGAGKSRNRTSFTTRPKVSSADSLLAMLRNLTTSTTSCATTTNATVFISPSTTPTASSPQDDLPGDDESSTSSMHTPVSFSSGAPDSPIFYRQTTIEVPVLDVLNAHRSTTASSSTSSSSSNLLQPPTIFLEIPNSGINNKCLSPIHEMPTPIPSPALTPIMTRTQRSNSPIYQQKGSFSIGDYSDDDEKVIPSTESDEQISEKIIVNLRTGKTRTISAADSEISSGASRTAVQSLNPPPAITIDVVPPTPEEKNPRPRNLIIPTLTVEQPSPTKTQHPMTIYPGSPPPQRASIGIQQKRHLKHFEKPSSLDFPFVPPMITVTSNMSEMESDAEPLSPASKIGGNSGLMPPNPSGMCYLSPFTICNRADRSSSSSSSNLSSSGYSSMASPCPSRCGSSNPLYPNEMDEPGSGHTGPSLSMNHMGRRRHSTLASCKESVTNGDGTGADSGAGGNNTNQLHNCNRPRSDSETFSDEIIFESNDEGIGTDHVDEKLDESRLRSKTFKLLDVCAEEHILIEVEEPPQPAISITTNNAASQMAQLQLPSIVIQIDGNEKGLSPVSSRSESPLSERASIGRFSPHFYGRKDQLPFTDSDGLYDFPSSDGKGTSKRSYSHQRRSSSKKRERKSSKCSMQSPTKQQLDVSPQEPVTTSTPTPSNNTHICSKYCHSLHHPCLADTITARKSPKRRLNSRPPVASSSSSSESLISKKELTARPLPRRLNSPKRKQEHLSEDEVAEEMLRRISPNIVKEEDVTKPKCKIGNQIRFLRRLKKSIKTRERLASPTDSCPEEYTDDMDSPQATSPLLQPLSPSKTRIALCRQKRLPSGTYGITSAALNSRSLIGDDLNSD